MNSINYRNQLIAKFQSLNQNESQFKTISEIARELDVNRTTARKYLTKYGIKYFKHNYESLSIPIHEFEYNTYEQLAAKYNCSTTKIHYYAKVNNLTVSKVYYDYSAITKEMFQTRSIQSLSEEFSIPISRLYDYKKKLNYEPKLSDYMLNLFEMLCDFDLHSLSELREYICSKYNMTPFDYDSNMLCTDKEFLIDKGLHSKYIVSNSIKNIYN